MDTTCIMHWTNSFSTQLRITVSGINLQAGVRYSFTKVRPDGKAKNEMYLWENLPELNNGWIEFYQGD